MTLKPLSIAGTWSLLTVVALAQVRRSADARATGQA